MFTATLNCLFYGLLPHSSEHWAMLVLIFSETVIALHSGRFLGAAPPISTSSAVMNSALVLPGPTPRANLASRVVCGSGAFGFWVGVVRSIATAFSYSFFWCLATAIYFLLRQDVDQTEFDEVYLEDAEEPYGLPLKPDKHGVPTVPPPLPTPAAKKPEAAKEGDGTLPLQGSAAAPGSDGSSQIRFRSVPAGTIAFDSSRWPSLSCFELQSPRVYWR
jgi:hypothetical protein